MNDEEEVVTGDTEQLDFTRPAFVFTPREQHEWKQQGPYLVCRGCEIQHAVFVGMGKQLVGLREDGTPILKSR